MEQAASKLEHDEATGAGIVGRSLAAPLTQIAVNAGMEGGVVVAKVKDLNGPNGLNAATGEYEDLIAAGIIDAAKVTRSALQNAASIAALFLTTEAVIADVPEESGAAKLLDSQATLAVRRRVKQAARNRIFHPKRRHKGRGTP